MTDQRSYVVYRDLLLGAGHGNPFFIPEPHEALPSEYTNCGIRIGDVGLLTEKGGFDFLFNIHKAADHPFQHLPLVYGHTVHSDIHNEKCTITRGQVTATDITLAASAQVPPFAEGGFSFNFAVGKSEAAVLFLPDGATCYNAKDRAAYLRYAKENGIALYQYVNGALGREAVNGSLYIVTGCDKCRSWGLAAASETKNERDVSLNFRAVQTGGATVAVHRSSNALTGLEARSYPHQPDDAPHEQPHTPDAPPQEQPHTPDAPPHEQNQCVFGRGIIIVLPQKFRSDKPGPGVKLSQISGSKEDSSWTPPSHDWAPYSQASSPPSSASTPPSSSSSSQGGQSRNALDQSLDPNESSSDESDVVADVKDFPKYNPLNPGSYLGDYALFKCPSARLAVVEDKTWLSGVDENEGIDFDAVLREVLEQNTIEVVDGVALFKSNTDLRDSQLEVQVSDEVDRSVRDLPVRQATPLPDDTLQAGPSSVSSGGHEKIHALIIGIDSYKHTPLKGAVNDARDFQKYLLEQGVPAENIELLQDAKRTAIIDAFQSLKTNDAIVKDNAAIIIFFAGHGASSPIPEHWPKWQSVQAGGRIEQLCSVDIGELETDSGNVIQGIPDYDIRVWLDDLSRAKGNNITVILDCGYSGGMNRDGHDVSLGWVARCIEDRPELLDPPSFVDPLAVTAEPPFDLLSGTRAVKTVPEFAGTARESHILLAACNRNQRAHESQGRGHFTTALLNALREYPLQRLTYKTLMHLLVMPRHDDPNEKIQTPYCDGKFIRRRLFDSWSPEADAGLILCHRDGATTSFTLQAGALHGVTVGSEYVVFGTDSFQASPASPKATAEKVKPFTSILQFPPDAQIPAARDGQSRDVRYVRLFKEADLEVRLYCGDGDYLNRLVDMPDQGPTITISEKPTDADLVLKLNETYVSFERGNKTVIVEPDLGFPSLLSGQVPIDDLEHVRHVVKSYTRFLKHLTRARDASLPDGQDVIKLSLHRLQGTGQNRHPVGEDLLEGNPGVVTVVSKDAYYGLTLANLSNVRLFAYVFWFYPDTAEILLWNDARQPGQGDPSEAALPDTELEPGKVLGAGFGNGGIQPFYFEMPKDQSIDVSLFKVFVTATPADMTSLEQPSPFDNDAWRKPTKRDLPPDFWMATTITVVETAVEEEEPTKKHMDALITRFLYYRERPDLDEAIALMSRLSDESRDDVDLGEALVLRYEHSGEVEDLCSAISPASHVATSVDLDSMERFRAAQLWHTWATRLPDDDGGSVLMNAFKTAMILEKAFIGTLSAPVVLSKERIWALQRQHCQPCRPSLVTREITSKRMTPNLAAAHAIMWDELHTAIEWLEQGRSIIWDQLLQSRVPLDMLHQEDPGLVEKLAFLAKELSISSTKTHFWEMQTDEDGIQRKVPLEDEGQKHRKLAIEWQEAVCDARKLPGLNDFLLPKDFNFLSNAAYDSIIIIINISVCCDALIIFPGSAKNDIRRVPLPELTLLDVEQMHADLLSLIRDDMGIRTELTRRPVFKDSTVDPNPSFRKMLADLWYKVVQPIICEGMEHRPLLVNCDKGESRAHVRWCLAVRRSFSLLAGVETRSHPHRPEDPLSPKENQCIFARGITIVLQKAFFIHKLCSGVQLPQISGSQGDSSWTPPSSSWVPYSSASSTSNLPSSSSSFQGGQSRNALNQSLGPIEESGDGSKIVAQVENVPKYSTLPLNLCFYLGDYALFKCPSAELAVVEDETWIKTLDCDEKGVADFDAVHRKVLEQHNIEVVDRVALFKSHTHLYDSQVEVKVSDEVDRSVTDLPVPQAIPLLDDTFQTPTSPFSDDGQNRLAEVGGLSHDLAPLHVLKRNSFAAQIHALVIGINEYSKYPKLSGAVNDAHNFKNYLASLDVPTGNVTLLVDGKATRLAIINALESFSTNDRIERNSAIIIFFAGHGTSSRAPASSPAWHVAGRRVEQLCPVDIGEEDPDHRRRIEGIPDRTIRVLLDQLSAAKGNNITLILDCCHSGGMNRGRDTPREQNPNWTARFIENPPPISGSFDVDLFSSVPSDRGWRSLQISNKFTGMANESHILLAACSSQESAYEGAFGPGGHFTTTLLEVLRAHSVQKLTYKSLWHRLVIPNGPPQTPHCEGRFRGRRLFNCQTNGADWEDILCRRHLDRSSNSVSFTLEAGKQHGITVGSEYHIFEHDLLDDPSAAFEIARVKSTSIFTSVLELVEASAAASSPHNLTIAHVQNQSDVRYARLSKDAGALLRVYCSDRAYVQGVVHAGDKDLITVVDNANEADLVLRLDAGSVTFEHSPKVLEPVIVTQGMSTSLSGTVAADTSESSLSCARSVVDSYARFLKHLKRTEAPPVGKPIFDLSFRLLQKMSTGDYRPVGPNLFNETSDTITVTSNDDLYYGLTLRNMTRERLFVHLFLFFPKTGEIMLWYRPPQSIGFVDTIRLHSLDTALNPGGTLAAGFGNGGVHPFNFSEQPDTPVDVTILKIFASTVPTDMTSLVQASAFKSQFEASMAEEPPFEKLSSPHDTQSFPSEAQFFDGALSGRIGAKVLPMLARFWMTQSITFIETSKPESKILPITQ